MHKLRNGFLSLSSFLFLIPGIAQSQYAYFPNEIVVIPSIPVAQAPNTYAQFTVVLPIESVRFLSDSIIQPKVQSEITVTNSQSPTRDGTIEIRIAYNADASTFTGQVYDATGIPVLVTVLTSGNYTINYYTKSTAIPNDQYVLRLSRRIAVVSSANANKYQLENPQPNSFQSGVGLISGWACVPSNLSILIDGNSVSGVPGGGARLDTTAMCGHANTGFGLLVNYNELTSGQHTIQLASSAPTFVSPVTSFQVVLPGDPAPFLRGLNKDVSIPGFPFSSRTTTLTWQESLQNFSIKGVQ